MVGRTPWSARVPPDPPLEFTHFKPVNPALTGRGLTD